jgi:NTE family protein
MRIPRAFVEGRRAWVVVTAPAHAGGVALLVASRAYHPSPVVREVRLSSDGTVAFVLGGGGSLGAYEVGMLRALVEAEIAPDLVLGTSVGAINGAVIAAYGATEAAVRQLTELWTMVGDEDVFTGSVFARVGTLVRSGTHLYTSEPLRELLELNLPVRLIEELALPFQCVAASIERAGPHWFTDGPLIDAVLASSAVPGLFAPVRIGAEHYVDGGLVHSIPIGRAVRLGATTVYVLHVGRVEEPLTPPANPLQVGLVAFEIARRHRFVEEMARHGSEVTVHVLPTGDPPKPTDLSQQLRYRDFSRVPARIDQAFQASADYLEDALR